MAELSGMGMLLKTLGVNPDEIRASIDSFMSGQKELLTRIAANQERLEASSARIEAKLQFVIDQQVTPYPHPSTTTELLSNGRPTGIVVSDEKFPQVVLDDAASNGQR